MRLTTWLLSPVGDPWFYNEYVDGRKLPPQFENFNAANDLLRRVVQQSGSNNN